MENVTFDWFNQYFCTGEHFQSDLDIFQFDFMFVKPHDVPPLLCFNVQTEMRFGVDQLLFTMPTLWKQELLYSKSLFSLHIKAKQRRHIMWFHKHKINWNMSRSHWKCSPVHKYWLNQSKLTFSAYITEGVHCVYPRMGEWVTRHVITHPLGGDLWCLLWF